MASPSSSESSHNHLVLNAAFTGNLTRLKELGKELDKGEGVAKALLKIKDHELRNALHYAAKGGQTDVCEYLIEELKFDANMKDALGSTPLKTALMEGQNLTIAYMLDHGADINLAGPSGLTVLHYAAQKGRIDQLSMLISKGAEVDAQSSKGTPLHVAALYGMRDAAQMLLENGANPNALTYSTCTPLMAAIMENHVDCVRLLLEFGANPNLSLCVHTHLTVAAISRETKIFDCLLKAGADANATNSLDLTPIEVAAKLGNLAGVRALFPATSQIPSIPDWSVSGILEYFKSDEVRNQLNLKCEEKFQDAKSKGAEAVKNKDYMTAIQWYTEAMGLNPIDAAVRANRSLCWAHLKEGHYALEDAQAAIRLREDWPKARYRAAVAYTILGDYRMAACVLAGAWELDTRNDEIQKALHKTLLDWKAVATDDEECEVYLTFPLLGRCTVRAENGPPSYLRVISQKTERLFREMNR